jgi:hypothetical protein
MRLVEIFGRKEGVLDRPLGIRPDVTLSSAQIESLQLIDKEDFSFVRQRLLKDEAVPPMWAEEVVTEYKRFLGLHAVFPSAFLTMRDGSFIDEAWHAHILFTRAYAEFCARVFGNFFHHDPFSKPDPDPLGSWNKFKSTYESLYGDMNHLWLIHAPESR